MAERLHVELREEFGKGAARRIRARNQVPAVFYGHGAETRHLTLPGHETLLITRQANPLIELTLADGRSRLALVKEVQRHPVKRTLTHLDLLEVRRGEKVEVEVPVTVVGEPVPPAVATLDLLHIAVSADATRLPEHIEIDVEGMEDGSAIHAGELNLPAGTDLVADPELLVVAIAEPRVEELPEDTEEAGTAEGAETAEGEEPAAAQGEEPSEEE